jgi:prenyltransferase beta subunit
MRLLLCITFSVAVFGAAAAIAAPSPANQARLDSTIRYLQNVQQMNGGFAAAAGEPSQIATAWTALSLAAAGINPQDQARQGGTDAYTYLVTHYWDGVSESDCAPIACTTTFEREMMVANASGTSPRNFGGIDLVAELLNRKREDGSFPHVPGGKNGGVNDTIFAILALVPVQEPQAQEPIQSAAKWVEEQQRENGGWSWKAGPEGIDEVDMTGAAIQALVAAGQAESTAVSEGLEYIRKAQNPDGGFPEFPGDPESNVASTAWAVQAIWSVGENPETWTPAPGNANEPLDYMESLQEPDGHIRWKKSQDLNGVWMTAYVAPAFAGQAWPIPAAPRSLHPPTSPQPGEGEGTQSGAGVIAGGGSEGAPLFSRPKPQSKGKTPGGARVVTNEELHATDHSAIRRGPNTRPPSGIERAEADSGGQEPSAVAGSTAARSSGESGDDSGRGREGGGESLTLPSTPAAEGNQGEEVSGTVIGGAGSDDGGELAFGAPGLHGAGSDEGEKWLALAIGGVAALLALGGAGWERQRREALL